MAPFVSLHAAREADFRCGLDAQSTVTERGCVSCPVQAECFMNHMVPGCTHARKCETDAIVFFFFFFFFFFYSKNRAYSARNF